MSTTDQLDTVAREIINLPETEKETESQLPKQAIREVAKFSCGFFKRLLEGSLRKDV